MQPEPGSPRAALGGQWRRGELGRELAVALGLARRAGRLARDMAHRAPPGGLPVHHPPDRADPVSAADLACDTLLRGALAAAFPRDGVVSEESSEARERAWEAARVWVVDPLDGTKYFLRGEAGWCVMIGLVVDGRPVLGAVYQPQGDRLWWGIAGRGAYELGRAAPLRVSACGRLIDDLRLVVRPCAAHRIDALRAALGAGPPRQMSSVGLKICLVAAGEADLFVQLGSGAAQWDTAAGHAILEAAGGRASALDGRPLAYGPGDPRHRAGLLVSNAALHGAAVAALPQLVPAAARLDRVAKL